MAAIRLMHCMLVILSFNVVHRVASIDQQRRCWSIMTATKCVMVQQKIACMEVLCCGLGVLNAWCSKIRLPYYQAHWLITCRQCWVGNADPPNLCSWCCDGYS